MLQRERLGHQLAEDDREHRQEDQDDGRGRRPGRLRLQSADTLEQRRQLGRKRRPGRRRRG